MEWKSVGSDGECDAFVQSLSTPSYDQWEGHSSKKHIWQQHKTPQEPNKNLNNPASTD